MGFFSDVWEGAKDLGSDIVEGGKDVIDAGVDFAGDVVDGVGDVVGEIVSWAVDIPEQPDIESQARGALVNKQSNVAPLPIIYGERRVGGVRVFTETSGTDNKFLYLCIVLCEGEVESITDLNIDDTPLSGSKYEPYVTFEVKTGSDDQSVSNVLLDAPSWDSNDRLRGIAYIAIKLEFDQDAFSSVPDINALVKGRKLFDPRTSAVAWSSNPALALRDYLIDERYGKGLPENLIDDAAFSDSADSCEVQVETTEGSGEFVNKFDINAIVETDKTLFDNVSQILGSMQGLMPYQNGKYRLIIEDDYDSTFDFTIDNIIEGMSFSGPNKKRRFNRVIAKFVNPDANWQADSVTWPEPDSQDSANFLTEDNNVVLEKQIDLNSVTNYYQARNIAKTLCLSSRRNGISIDFTATSEAMQCAVSDVVTITHPTPGWDGKEFRITRMSINFDGTVNIAAREHTASVYPWVNDKDEPASAQSNLPDPLTVAAPSVRVTDELQAFNEEAITVLLVDLDTGDSFLERFEVQARKAGTTEFINLGQAGGDRFELVNVEDDATYTVRARSINSLGVRSAFTTVQHQVVGKTAPPSDVTGLTGNLIGNQYLLTWNAVPDLDLSHYRIRFASDDDGNEYQNSVSLVPKVARPATSVLVPARNGTYFVKAIDKLGLASTNAANIRLQSNIEQLENLNVVQRIDEHPNFDGTFDDVVEIDEQDRIVLDTSIDFDSVTGLFDDATGQFDAGEGNVDAEGFYFFGQSTDLGEVFISRVTANLKTVRVDYVNLFDQTPGLFDNRPGLFDGDPNAFDDVDVELQIRTTEDDPAGTPTFSDWQPFVVGDYKARAMEYRARLTTTDPEATPAVSELTVTVDMPDRTERDFDVVSGAGAKVVTFNTAFKETPAIGIGAQDLQTGDFYEITNKTRLGFTITFKNSGGTAVSRTFDYTAAGYGKEVA
jgi:hypothetical protein